MNITWQAIVLAAVTAAVVIGLAVLKQLPEGVAAAVVGVLTGLLVPSHYDGDK